MIIKNQKVITFTEKELQALASTKYILCNIKEELDGITVGGWNSDDFLFARNLLNDLLDATVCSKLILNTTEKIDT